MQIHQLLPGYQFGDAISSHARGLRRLLRTWGHSSEIFAQHIGPSVRQDCLHIANFPRGHDSITIYHYSIGADEITDLFLTSPGKRLLIYHNITPHHYFADYDPYEVEMTKSGRDGLADLQDAADMVLADSAFNCGELTETGFRNPRILPILVDYAAFEAITPCAATMHQFDDDWINFLFVGRLVPNKRQDHLITAFAYYNRFINRRSRLFLVGSDDKESYVRRLRRLSHVLEMEDHIEFTGHVGLPQLLAYYKLADLFLCMSEHEGFCVPFLEAFHHDVPVLAYKAAAIPETMGDAGVLVSAKDYKAIAEMADLLITNRELRDQVILRQNRSLARFEPQLVAQKFRAYLNELIAA
jgi:glycosyltransferase involved in cell wall biosynthesis